MARRFELSDFDRMKIMLVVVQVRHFKPRSDFEEQSSGGPKPIEEFSRRLLPLTGLRSLLSSPENGIE
jgi:hypothetical protein